LPSTRSGEKSTPILGRTRICSGNKIKTGAVDCCSGLEIHKANNDILFNLIYWVILYIYSHRLQEEIDLFLFGWDMDDLEGKR
jgi:hypothetical protein